MKRIEKTEYERMENIGVGKRTKNNHVTVANGNGEIIVNEDTRHIVVLYKTTDDDDEMIASFVNGQEGQIYAMLISAMHEMEKRTPSLIEMKLAALLKDMFEGGTP